MKLIKYPYLFFLFFICIQLAQAQKLTPLDFKKDLDYMVTELEARHANLYHSISEEDFKDSLALLEQDLPDLNRLEFIEQLAKLTALIGDGHTGLLLPFDRGFEFRLIPVRLHHDGNGYFIIAASQAYKSAIGKKLVKIEGVNIEDIKNTILPMLPKDNKYRAPSLAGTYMRLFELMQHLGYVKSQSEEMILTLAHGNGNIEEVSVNPVNLDYDITWEYITPKEDLPLYLKKIDEQYWFDYLPESKSAYLQFNSADISGGYAELRFKEFTDSLVSFIDQNDVDRLIIDLRWNTGGSFVRTRYLLWAAIRSEKINKKGKLFTIVGPSTFSAATALATELDLHTNTIFVGEPTGGKPNSFGDLGRLMLPKSNVQVRYARWEMHQSLRDDHRPAIFPDLRAQLTHADYVNNTDPAMEVILNYETKEPIGSIIEMEIKEKGIDAAVKMYWDLRKNQFNKYDFGELELNSLGYKLLGENKTEEALKLFKVNAQVYPYSPNSYDSLGDAYRELGQLLKALKLYEKAFSIDKQYSHSRDKAQEILNTNQ